jgi:hypothetical protein
VAFPEVSAGSLVGEARAVAARARELERAREQLRSAEAALSQSKQVLLRSVQKATAYARIYAMGDDQLTQALDAIAPPRPKPRGSAPHRRKRASRREGDSGPPEGSAAGQTAQPILDSAESPVAGVS